MSWAAGITPLPAPRLRCKCIMTTAISCSPPSFPTMNPYTTLTSSTISTSANLRSWCGDSAIARFRITMPLPSPWRFSPAKASFNQFSAFVQDEIGFFEQPHAALRLVLNSSTTRLRVSSSNRTYESSAPSAKKQYSLGGSFASCPNSRDNRRGPAVECRGYSPEAPPLNSPLPVIEPIFGSTQFESEDLIAYEAGYRVQATSTFSAGYSRLFITITRIFDPPSPVRPLSRAAPTPSYVVLPFVAEQQDGRRNLRHRTFRGVENSPQMEILRVL